MVQHEDSRPWTNGTVVGNKDHNHNNRSYTICITKTAKLITRNNKHVQTTLITAEHYLWDQADKQRRTDTVEDIIKQFEKQ